MVKCTLPDRASVYLRLSRHYTRDNVNEKEVGIEDCAPKCISQTSFSSWRTYFRLLVLRAHSLRRRVRVSTDAWFHKLLPLRRFGFLECVREHLYLNRSAE